MGAQHRAAQQRRRGGAQQRRGPVATRGRRQPAAQGHHGHGQRDRQHGERDPVGVLVAGQAGDRQHGPGQRRVLEGDVAVGQVPVQEDLRVGGVQRQVGDRLVVPRAGEEGQREARRQQGGRARGGPHAGHGAAPAVGSGAPGRHQRHQGQRREPHDVEVEPVADRQLHRDDHGGAQGRDLERVAAARHEEHRQRQDPGADLDRGLQPAQRVDLAPDAERRRARGLVADRAVVDLADAAVGQEGHEHERPGSRPAPTPNRAPSRTRLPPVPAAISGASAMVANLAPAPSATAAPRPSAERAGGSVSASSAATVNSATSVSLVFVSSANSEYG